MFFGDAKMVTSEDIIKDFYKMILIDKNVKSYRTEDETQKLIDSYIIDNNMDVLNIILNKSVLEFRTIDEQLMLIEIYRKNPFYEVKKIITDYQLLKDCRLKDQITLIKEFIFYKNQETEKKKEPKKKKRLFMWRVKHN